MPYKKWQASKDVYIEKYSGCIMIVSGKDNVFIAREELDNLINTLQKVNSYYQTQELTALDEEKLEQWNTNNRRLEDAKVY